MFFGNFNSIITHIFPENFIEISQIFRKIEDFLRQYYFYQFFGFFGISLLQTNKWNQHITDGVRYILLQPTLNRLFNKMYLQKAQPCQVKKNLFTMLFNSQFIKQSIANPQRQHPNQPGYYLYWSLFAIYILIITLNFFLFQQMYRISNQNYFFFVWCNIEKKKLIRFIW